MVSPIRLAAALLALVFARDAGAQPEVAPPPHRPVAELARLYKQFGLPDPAKAELVRVKSWDDQTVLALRFPSPVPHSMRGWKAPEPIGWEDESGVAVGPTPAALDGAAVYDGLNFVAQCELRGWHELAAAAYAQIRAREPGDYSREPFAVRAWRYWEWELIQPASDRRAALAHMRAIHKLHPELLGSANSTLLDDLECAVAPRKSKPGTPEALIDDLIDAHGNWPGHESYWKLAEMGLDAVPVLLKHIDDRRCTRIDFDDLSGQLCLTRVGHLVGNLLNGLSNERFGREYHAFVLDIVVAPDEHKWWAEARKMGEEKWLLANVFPDKTEDGDAEPRPVALRAIRAKYPHRLKDVYDRVLSARRDVWGGPVVEAIVASKLPRKEKLAALAPGLIQADCGKRAVALGGLADLDRAAFDKQLSNALETVPGDLWEDADPGALALVELLRKTDDANCWTAAAAAMRLAPPLPRWHIMGAAACQVERGDPGWRECLRFLLTAASDDDVWGGIDGVPLHINTFALELLSHMYGIDCWRYPPQSLRERSLLRTRGRDRAELELLRPAGAQPEVAPPPHLPRAPEPQVALEGLVRECRALGVRLPPANTQLVRAGYDAKTPFPQLLFRNPLPVNGTRSVTFHDGAELEYNKHIFKTYDRPTPADLDGLHYDYFGWLKLAVKLRSRGWDEAARAALDRARAAAVAERKDDEPLPNLLRTVRTWALYQWADEFFERDSDRPNAVRRIRAIVNTDPVLETTYRSWLADLEQTIAPRQSKPGSVEALIDDLTDFWVDPKDSDNKRGQEAYDKLYDLGFESVPALIEHLADRRFTRASARKHIKDLEPSPIRVGELVSGLLDDLSGSEIGSKDAWWFYGRTASPEVARAWWARARPFGEENWLLECVLPLEDWEGAGRPCERAIHLIAKRYPHRLPALYQTLLLKRGDVQSEHFVRAITSSTLPKSRKIELLTTGAANRLPLHVVEALDGLQQLDAKAFAESWLVAFNHVPEKFWDDDCASLFTRSIRFVLKTDDPRCWDALATRTARLSPDGRAKIISAFDDPLEATKGPRLYLRYLLSHITDHAPASYWNLLGFRVYELTVSESATRALDSALEVDLWSAARKTKSPRERSLLRALVCDRAELELLRLERP